MPFSFSMRFHARCAMKLGLRQTLCRDVDGHWTMLARFHGRWIKVHLLMTTKRSERTPAPKFARSLCDDIRATTVARHCGRWMQPFLDDGSSFLPAIVEPGFKVTQKSARLTLKCNSGSTVNGKDA